MTGAKRCGKLIRASLLAPGNKPPAAGSEGAAESAAGNPGSLNTTTSFATFCASMRAFYQKQRPRRLPGQNYSAHKL